MTFLWLMYAGDTVSALTAVFGIFAGLCVVGYGFWSIFAFMEDFNRPPLKLFVTAAALAVVACVLPSQRVFYAAAAISAGKQVAETETGEKAIKALNAWLNRQAQPENGK